MGLRASSLQEDWPFLSRVVDSELIEVHNEAQRQREGAPRATALRVASREPDSGEQPAAAGGGPPSIAADHPRLMSSMVGVAVPPYDQRVRGTFLSVTTACPAPDDSCTYERGAGPPTVVTTALNNSACERVHVFLRSDKVGRRRVLDVGVRLCCPLPFRTADPQAAVSLRR